MVASDVDAVILRIQELRGITYDQAQAIFRASPAVLSVPVSDAQISVAVDVTSAVVSPQKTDAIAARTPVCKSGYFTGTTTTSYTVHTVTGGKTLYVTQVEVAGGNVDDGVRFGDNISATYPTAGTVRSNEWASAYGVAGAGNATKISFDPPMKISTLFNFVNHATAVTHCSINGWEE